MKTIKITRGLLVKVDNSDYPSMSRHPWFALPKPDGRVYAIGKNGGCKMVRMHRVIVGAASNQIVDHINGDSLDNRRCNLRVTDASGNARNRKPQGEIPYIGVNRSGRGYHAYVRPTPHGNKLYLGTYSTPEYAALAYDQSCRNYKIACARLNFPEVTDYSILLKTRLNGAQHARKTKDGFYGVAQVKSGRWKARLNETYIGAFPTAEEACTAYDSEARRRFGDLAIVNNDLHKKKG
jgi:hypothetical protein